MSTFRDISVKVKSEDTITGVYEISPLPRGYGHTLVNSLRRILLSSIEGAGITSVKISGIDHEYSAVKGVREDVIELLLNIKSIRVKSESTEPQICKLSVKGEKVVTAGDIQIAGPVEIVNKDLVIANLTDASAKLDMEFTIERGVGYRQAEDTERSELGRIPLDTDFSPVRKVNFEVVNTRKGQETDLDQVNITIETDGSVAPKDALLQSVKILQDFAGKVMVALGVSKLEVEELAEASKIIEAESAKVESKDEVSSWRIEDLPISKRSKSGLLYGGYQTVGELGNAKLSDLKSLPGFGAKSLNEILELLNQYGIQISED